MEQRADSQFPATHWTLIARVKSDDEAVATVALNEVCLQYYYPLYCYARRRGLSHHDAQDALQDFMAKLLRLDLFKSADMAKGRLRSLLATALQRFLINWQRGGKHRRQEVSMDALLESRYEQERFADLVTPEMALERSWASTLLRSALDDLAHAEVEGRHGGRFAVLEPFLSPAAPHPHYGKAAEALGQSEGTVRQMVNRLRDKFRTHLRKRVAETLREPTAANVDEEMFALRSALSN